jgi:hypothetical protein
VVGACGISGRANYPGLHYDLLTRPAEGRGTFSLPAQFLDYTATGGRSRGASPARGSGSAPVSRSRHTGAVRVRKRSVLIDA